jgi:hypothetical protein
MIARYIYTDCASDGPYAKGTGYKFKSVVFPFGQGSLEAVKELLPKNSLAEGYELPDVPDSMTSTDFANLPKSWAYAKTSSGTYSFQRMSTNGKSYGRPNKFFEGFTFTQEEFSTLTQKSSEQTKPMRLRPVDFVRSNGWLNPRGELELEQANLDDSFYRIDDSFKERLKDALAEVRRLPNLQGKLAGFAEALIGGTATALPTELKPQFFAIVSVFTRLIPAEFAMQVGFSDVWACPRSRDLADGRNPHIILSNQETAQGALAKIWGEFAAEAMNSGIIGKLIKRLDDISSEQLIFNADNREEALAALPLAVLLSDPADLEGKTDLATKAKELLKRLDAPASNSEKIEQLLANLGGAE